MTHTTDALISALAIAGYADERTLWLMLRDVARQLRQLHAQSEVHGAVDARHVAIQGKTFVVCEKAAAHDNVPTSAPDDIWALGALAYQLALGCELFGGRGAKAQKADTPLPVVRHEWNELSRLVRQMLDYAPAMRPTAEDVERAAERALARPTAPLWKPRKSVLTEQELSTDELDRLWPDTF